MNWLRHIVFCLIIGFVSANICNDDTACNYGEAGDCEFPDVNCDCDENILDAAYVCDGTPVLFQHNQSTSQAFYYLDFVTINGTPVDTADWVGAFNGDVCVGARNWGICGGGTCDVPVQGDDGSNWTNGYCNSSDIPAFKIYDESEDAYYDAMPSEDLPWVNFGFITLDSLNAYIIDLYTSETGYLSPDNYSISSIYPNPFNPITSIEYSLLENATIDLSVYNIHGRHIQTLIRSFQTTGYHSVNWNASSYPSGVYLIRLKSGNFSLLSRSRDPGLGQRSTKKVVLIK